MDSPSNSPVALKVVAIGGGTGLATLLRGLKQFVACRQRRTIGACRRLPGSLWQRLDIKFDRRGDRHR